jgi:hypothetical protein
MAANLAGDGHDGGAKNRTTGPIPVSRDADGLKMGIHRVIS